MTLFFGPDAVSRIGDLLPGTPCPDAAELLLHAEDLPGDWEAFQHPDPAFYMAPPFVLIDIPEESAAGVLFLPRSGSTDNWAVERVYCLRNPTRGIGFFYQSGFAGYVEALGIPDGSAIEDLRLPWAPELGESSQGNAQCRLDPINAVPSAADPPSGGVRGERCGVWARYGRHVVAFEAYAPAGELKEEFVQALVDAIEARMLSIGATP